MSYLRVLTLQRACTVQSITTNCVSGTASGDLLHACLRGYFNITAHDMAQATNHNCYNSQASRGVDIHKKWGTNLYRIELPCVSRYVSSRFRNFRRQFAERFSWSSWSTIVLNCVTSQFFCLCFTVLACSFFLTFIILYLYCLKRIVLYCIVSAAPSVRIKILIRQYINFMPPWQE